MAAKWPEVLGGEVRQELAAVAVQRELADVLHMPHEVLPAFIRGVVNEIHTSTIARLDEREKELRLLEEQGGVTQ